VKLRKEETSADRNGELSITAAIPLTTSKGYPGMGKVPSLSIA
jgi:hypothetical protein